MRPVRATAPASAISGPAAAPRAASRNSWSRSATACSSRPTLRRSPPTAQATLDKQAAWLNHYTNYRILIEGHADERGTREYNIALGARRASVVVNYLVARGVSADRITTKSFGKERPVAICNDISCW